MRALVLILCACGMSSEGQIFLLSDHRSVTASGFAQAGPEPPANHSASQSPNTPFTDFSGSVGGNASAYSHGTGPHGLDVSAYSSAHATQGSTIATYNFSASASVTAQTWSELSTWGGDCLAVAQSSFIVSFFVTESVPYELTCSGFFSQHSFPLLVALCSISSEENGLLHELSRSEISAGQTVGGMLESGNNYTLSFLLQTDTNIPDPFGQYGSINATMNFVLIPEPSAAALFAVGLGTWLLLRYKARHRSAFEG